MQVSWQIPSYYLHAWEEREKNGFDKKRTLAVLTERPLEQHKENSKSFCSFFRVRVHVSSRVQIKLAKTKNAKKPVLGSKKNQRGWIQKTLSNVKMLQAAISCVSFLLLALSYIEGGKSNIFCLKKVIFANNLVLLIRWGKCYFF